MVAAETANPDHKMYFSLSLSGAEILVLNTTGWHRGLGHSHGGDKLTSQLSSLFTPEWFY